MSAAPSIPKRASRARAAKPDQAAAGVDQAAAGAGRSSMRGWLAVAAVALGIFSLMTSELLPVALLTPIGSGLHVSAGTAGLMVTVPGLVAMVSAPLVTVAAGRVDRRVVLCALVGLVGAANLVSAVAPDFGVVLAARFLVGVGVGGFWAIAGGLAPRLVSERHVARATAIVFGGVSTASVLGVPAGTLIGDSSGWRTAFAAVGFLGLAALAALVLLLPSLPSQRTITFGELPRLLRAGSGVRTGVIITFLLITGHFAAYTFVRPILQQVSGIGGDRTGGLLLAYGIAGVIGNFAAGARAGHDVRRTVVTIAAALAAAVALFALVGGTPEAAIVLLLGWGLAYGGVSVSLQTWILKAAPQQHEAAGSLFVAAFNFSIAFGALVGGLAMDHVATTGTLWIATALAALTATVAATHRRPEAGQRAR
ncbi:MFS transporter [Actinomadura gamaensis]|uniref:MFS transporter n=1 Tax=Actinomadura gamaensis TaxID=1763541 RepID=A0ABV9U8L8_9ACTN